MLKLKKENEVFIGSLLSYSNIIINSVYSLIVLPLVIEVLGQSDYGVYKTITSLSSSVLILDLGLGSTCIRYISKYIATNEESKIPKFIGMIFKIGTIVISILSLACCALYFLLPYIYKNGLTDNEIHLAKGLFKIVSLNIIFHMVDNILDGIISGYNRFAFSKGLKLTRVVVRAILVFVVLIVWKSPYVLVLIDLIITITMILAEIYYFKVKLKSGIKFGTADGELFKEVVRYTFLIFATSIINLVNGNLDNVIIGALNGASFVTIYSVGLTLFSMFNNLSTSISSVMLPTVTGIINQDSTLKKAGSFVVSVGRIQFMVLGAVLAGFICVGKQFIYLWMGAGYEDAYYLALILMIPAMFELVVNVCLSILRAKNLLGFRTLVLLCTTALNSIITYWGVKYSGYYYAAIGTAISCVVGNIIVINIYYYKKFSFNMAKFYGSIFSRSWICLVVASVVLLICSSITEHTWGTLIGGIVVFLLVYIILQLIFGLNNDERWRIKKALRRR